MAPPVSTALLEIAGLTVGFPGDRGSFTAVRDLSFAVSEGETLAVVGKSGSGKSVTAMAITRLLDYGGGRIESGAIRFRDRAGVVRDLARESPQGMRALRGPEMAMVFQEPMTSLNPVLRIGDQIAEAIELHQGRDHAAARAEAQRMLERVRHTGSGATARSLRIPALGRDAPAGDDRDGALLPPAPADRR